MHTLSTTTDQLTGSGDHREASTSFENKLDKVGDIIETMVGGAVKPRVPVTVGGMDREDPKSICGFDIPPERVTDHRCLQRFHLEMFESAEEVPFRRFPLTCPLRRHHNLEEMGEPRARDPRGSMLRIRIGHDCHQNTGPPQPL